MIEMLLGARPENETQRNISYAAKLYGLSEAGNFAADRLFKSKKEELEEILLQRQIDAMGRNPTDISFSDSLQNATIAGKTLSQGGGFLSELLKKRWPASPLYSPLPKNVISLNQFKSQIMKLAR